MTKLVRGMLTVVGGLSRRERQEFIRGLLESGVLTEDDQDRLTIESRRKDRTRPLADFMADMKRKGRLP